MRFTNKRRLLLILHWCGSNLLMVLGNGFPTIDELLPTLHFNQSNIPLQMTDCFFMDDDCIDVSCDNTKWQESIDVLQIPPQVRLLNIRNSSFTSLGPDALNNVSISVLNLGWNEKLKSIDENAFNGLNNTLEVLKIKKSLFEVPESRKFSFFYLFRQLKSLKYLLLEDNYRLSLVNVNTDLFDHETHLENLEYLSFQGSNIQRLESEFFWPLRKSTKLTALNLINCNLSSISERTFRNLPYLERIDFRENPKLLKLFSYHNTPFLLSLGSINSRNLRHLGLSNSDIYYTPYFLMMHFMWHLETIDLSENDWAFLGHISGIISLTVFPPMQNLRNMHLGNSFISSIKPDTFEPLLNIETLNLTKNQLTYIPKGALRPTLQVLDLSYQNGPFTFINNQLASSEAKNLRVLSLRGNNFRTIWKDSFKGLESLAVLDISYSRTFEIIQEFTFTNTPFLRKLDMSKNPILCCINNDTLKGLDKLEYLDLSFSSNVFISKKDQSGSNHSNLKPAEPLYGLQSLKFLNVSCALNPYCYSENEYNPPLDPEYLKSLHKLEILDLSWNSLAEWQDERFAFNPKLKKLYLNSNSMSHLTSGLLKTFSTLEEIDFRRNKLECEKEIIDFINLTLEYPNLNVVGWDNGTGYYCRNMTDFNYTKVSFKEFHEWYDEYGNEDLGNEFPWIRFSLSCGGLLIMGFILGKFA